MYSMWYTDGQVSLAMERDADVGKAGSVEWTQCQHELPTFLSIFPYVAWCVYVGRGTSSMWF